MEEVEMKLEEIENYFGKKLQLNVKICRMENKKVWLNVNSWGGKTESFSASIFLCSK